MDMREGAEPDVEVIQIVGVNLILERVHKDTPSFPWLTFYGSSLLLYYSCYLTWSCHLILPLLLQGISGYQSTFLEEEEEEDDDDRVADEADVEFPFQWKLNSCSLPPPANR